MREVVDEIVRWGTEAKVEKIKRLGRKKREGRGGERNVMGEIRKCRGED